MPRLTELVGRSAVAHDLDVAIHDAARSDAKVLITGETGSGKEVVARLIHARSRRSAGAFVAINCGGIPELLLESELFGHERGSFTGAHRDRPGRLELAHGGTAFLDEVGEMSPRMQGLLLRFLETGELQRVGASHFEQVADVRVIAATNRPLAEAMTEGAFREDLYYRLDVVHIDVPPLRERAEDIPLLARHLLEEFSVEYRVAIPDLQPETLERLVAYHWPGNVRELKNLLERLVVRHGGKAIEPQHVSDEIGSRQPPPAAPPVSTADLLFAQMVEGGQSFWSVVYAPFLARDLTRDDVRAIVGKGLERSHGNYRAMATLFNMAERDYRSFMRSLRKHECHLPFQAFRMAPARLRVATAPTGGDTATRATA